MKKLILLSFLFIVPFLMMAQTDVTSQYLTNAGFDDGTFQSSDLGSANGGANVKAISGWTVKTFGDNSAANLFAIGGQYYLNQSGTSGLPPATNYEGTATGGVLGISSAWAATNTYSQAVSFTEPGEYQLTYVAYNSGPNASAISKVGWVPTSGTSVISTKTSFPIGAWTVETLNFTITEATAGEIHVGLGSANAGSGNVGRLFFDYVKLTFRSFKAGLEEILTEATALYSNGSGTDAAALNTAISAAQSVYDNYSASSSEISAAVTALRQAIRDYQIANASAVSPADLTYKIVNPNFDSNSTGWTGGFAYGSGAIERYESIGKFYQILSGLPAGKYKLSVHGFCHNRGDDLGYLYAGTYEQKLPPRGAAAENNMADAAASFASGNYHVELEFIKLTGDLEIGIDVRGGKNWTIFDSFELKYLGADLTLFKEALQAQVTAADETYTGQPMHSNVASALATAIADALAVIDNESATQNDIEHAIAALTTATNAAAISVVSYVNADLSDLKVAGTTIAGFAASKTGYIYSVPVGTTTVPEVTYTTANASASAQVDNASAIGSATTITVTAESGAEKVYTVTFAINYLSDCTDGTTPHDAGWDGPAENSITWGAENTNQVSWRTNVGDPVNNGSNKMLYTSLEDTKLNYSVTLPAKKIYQLSGKVWRRNGGSGTLNFNFGIASDLSAETLWQYTYAANGNGAAGSFTSSRFAIPTSIIDPVYLVWDAKHNGGDWQNAGIWDLSLIEVGDALEVSFDTGEGSAIAPQYLLAGADEKATLPATEPTWGTHIFLGWYANAELTTPYDFDTSVTTDITLYAKWSLDPQVQADKVQLIFNDFNKADKTIEITGLNIVDDITVSGPAGLSFTPSTIQPGELSENKATVIVSVTGTTAIDGVISITSGIANKEVPVKYIPVDATNLISLANGPACEGEDTEPNKFGWSMTEETAATWTTAGAGANRYQKAAYNNNNWILFLRWDGSGNTTTSSIFSYPVQLQANSVYSFSGKYAWNSNGSAGTFTIGVNSANDNTGNSYASQPYTPEKEVLNTAAFEFATNAAGTYYLTFAETSGMIAAVADLSVTYVRAGAITEIRETSTDPIVAVRYYTLQGTLVQQPAENGIYIMKKIRESNKEEVSKIIYKK
ncbi:MAG: Gellan lyase [Candidatus Ordinivivax streblomastigis]|uniref:Gellan lyase n=1 Tax=Candidatus Ordinivivax streblomastigis TaxID=2540710 RepID=A0A5M8P359_9BACT|nr:MAG: Gellan lyase [Candidatus Ordinivivax streblomastigis]